MEHDSWSHGYHVQTVGEDAWEAAIGDEIDC